MTALEAGAASGVWGLCSWHGQFAYGVRLINILDQGSGRSCPAYYACGPCMATHRLVPLADRMKEGKR